MTPHRHMDNNNPKPDIERIKREVLENLRELAHTPSESHLTCWLVLPLFWQCIMHVSAYKTGQTSHQACLWKYNSLQSCALPLANPCSRYDEGRSVRCA